MDALIILIMFALVAVGMPITFSLGFASLLFFLVNDLSLMTFVQKMSISVDSFPLLALPFFILAGNLMNSGGITTKLFDCINGFMGSLRGGLAYVCILTSVVFSAMSGSALANAAGLGTLQIKAMEKEGYEKEFSASLIASASILGPIIPPSVIMIIYGVTAGASIRDMFIGGIVPGVIFSAILGVMCWYYGRKYNFPRGHKFDAQKSFRSFLGAIWALLVPVIILGGVFSGVFTATESGAVAALYAMGIGLMVYRTMTFKELCKVLYETGKTTGTILMITATGSLFGFCLTFSRVPQSLAASLGGAVSSVYVLLLIFLVVYLFLGCIMDGAASVITTVPIFAPLCVAYGIDLVYFGVFVGIIMSIGTITPPVGTAMFVICRNTGLTIEQFARKMVPFYIIMALFVVMLIIFPQIITALPNAMR
jgi:tripartite ATP-independent transporter DctM subunit